ERTAKPQNRRVLIFEGGRRREGETLPSTLCGWVFYILRLAPGSGGEKGRVGERENRKTAEPQSVDF
ncbi:MAG: hypothetical protein WCI17_04890, partial [bacterium]